MTSATGKVPLKCVSRAAWHGTAGFTLLELVITVAILALAAAVVLPGMSNLSRADLRQAASGLATTLRACYDNAALEGQVYRVSLAPGQHEVPLESSDAEVSLAAAADAGAAPRAQRRDSDPLAIANAPPESGSSTPLANLVGVNEAAAAAAETTFHRREIFKLPPTVRILDAWTEGMEAVQTQQPIYLYFFPSGLTQAAIIHLQDAQKRIFSLKVAPLTGQCDISAGYLELSK